MRPSQLARPRHPRRAVRSVIGLMVFALLAVAVPSSARADVTWFNRGTIPLYSATVVGGETGKMPDGSIRTYGTVSGQPGYLAEVDTFTRKTLRMFPLYVPGNSGENPPDAGASGAWGVSIDKRGNVFVSSYGYGHVYRLPWGGNTLEDLGRPNPRTSFTWEGDTDNQGNFFFGTSDFFGQAPLPGGRLYSWNAKTRSYRDYGDFGSTFGYVRSVEFSDGKIYAGLGQTAGLWQVNPQTGARKNIPLPEGMPTDKYAYQMEDEAGYLYVLFAGGTTATVGWVLDLKTLTWHDTIPGYNGQTISPADATGGVWLVQSGTLSHYQPTTKKLTTTALTDLGIGKAVGLVNHPDTGRSTVVGTNNNAQLWHYDVGTAAIDIAPMTGLKKTPTEPRSLATGPDGKVYAGGYFQGGFVSYDPATHAWTEHDFPHQIEGMATHAGKLYLGVYPSAQVWEYDPAKPYDHGVNPKKLFSLGDLGQERPWTLISAGDQLAVGTSPKNSYDNGAVTLYDPATGQHRTWNSGLVEGANQISSLAYSNGVLYGGSLGCCNFNYPKASGQAFAMNPSTGDVLWRSTPIPSEEGINGLTVDDQGRLFAMTYGTIMELDPANGAVLRSKQMFAYNWSTVTNFQPRAVNMSFDPTDGMIYASNNNTRRFDPDTLTDLGPNYRVTYAALPTGPSKYFAQGNLLLEVKYS